MRRLRPGAAAILVGLLLGLSVANSSAASLALTSQSFTPYRTCTLTATPATTTAVADATVRQGSATLNFGTLTTLTVSSAASANQRVYVSFNLAACAPVIPSSAVVRLATLRLYMTAVPSAVCRTIDLFKATASWTETGVTWNSQPFGTAINNPASGSRSGSLAVGTQAGCQNTAAGYTVGGTITTDVASFVAGGSTNFGWMLRDDVEGSATTRTATFSAKELGTVAQEPQLVVTYVTVP